LSENHPLDEIGEPMLERYLSDLSSQGKPLTPKRRQKIIAAIHLLFKHLRHAGLIATPPTESLPETEVRRWLTRYQEHLEKALGLAPKTCQHYLFSVTRLLEAVSQQGVIEWSAFTADKITAFLQFEGEAQDSRVQARAIAVRSFLRFLVSQGRLPAGLDAAVPNIRRSPQAALPQRLSETEINQLLTFCADQTATGRRNYAILLLLSRLGLRAQEVAGLQLGDIDWVNGSLLARSSKAHCQRLLPLPQDVGEAILSYLRHGRPKTIDREIFLSAVAPYQPLKSSSTISVTVKRLLSRAGIKSQSSGAHLLRHTAASRMVNRGASFKDVGDVLGHQQLQTTGIYAKLDLPALSEVALPWPGGAR
jgi:site-specific recombinase XerD